MQEALEKTRSLAPQTKVEVLKGLTVRRMASGTPILRLHYSADPDKDPATKKGAAWVKQAKADTTSRARWDREQEIIHNAGGGERVFAEVLTDFAHKIIISDPSWLPNPYWKKLGGFDHGKTNPTAAVVAYVDFDGTIYIAAEYYQPGKLIFENVPELKKLPGFTEAEYVVADPSMFTPSNQANGKASSFADEYYEQGLLNLVPYPKGADKSDAKFVERLMMHWARLGEPDREPTLKIVCREPIPDKPTYGIHADGCPSLLWELMRSRRVKLSETQLLSKNASEALVDKDNHLFDALKYLVMTLPEPAQKSRQLKIDEATEGMDFQNKIIMGQHIAEELDRQETPVRIGGMRGLRSIGRRR